MLTPEQTCVVKQYEQIYRSATRLDYGGWCADFAAALRNAGLTDPEQINSCIDETVLVCGQWS